MGALHKFKRNSGTRKLLLQRLRREIQVHVFFSTSVAKLLLLCTVMDLFPFLNPSHLDHFPNLDFWGCQEG